MRKLHKSLHTLLNTEKIMRKSQSSLLVVKGLQNLLHDTQKIAYRSISATFLSVIMETKHSQALELFSKRDNSQIKSFLACGTGKQKKRADFAYYSLGIRVSLDNKFQEEAIILHKYVRSIERRLYTGHPM